MSTKRFGGDATLWRGNTTSPSETNFTKVAGVTELAESGGESEMIDTTNRDDLASSPQRIQTPGLIAAISVDFSLHFDIDDAQHLDMVNDAEDRLERNYEIRQAGVTNKSKFRGFQKAIPKSYPMNEMIVGRTGIACSTRITFAP